MNKADVYDFICKNGETTFNDIVAHFGIGRDTPKMVSRYKQIDRSLFELLDAGLILRTKDYTYDKV